MLDVLVLVVRGCGSAGLPQELVTQVFPCVVQRILQSDDSSVLQVGCGDSRAYDSGDTGARGVTCYHFISEWWGVCESIPVNWSGAASSLVSSHPSRCPSSYPFCHPSPLSLPSVIPPPTLSSLCVSSGVSPLLSHRKDAAGYSGLHYVVQVIVHLLDPSRPEFSAAFVGKLIIVFVNKASISLHTTNGNLQWKCCFGIHAFAVCSAITSPPLLFRLVLCSRSTCSCFCARSLAKCRWSRPAV